jgi:hypothetical protein
MGTRADFYVGRGEGAVWLGSIAMDGHPDSHVQDHKLAECDDELHFRARVANLLADVSHSTLPEQGWPWPWKNSHTTDYAYTFADGKALVSCFGQEWSPLAGYIEMTEEQHDALADKAADVPRDMSAIASMAEPGSARSGIMVFSLKR